MDDECNEVVYLDWKPRPKKTATKPCPPDSPGCNTHEMKPYSQCLVKINNGSGKTYRIKISPAPWELKEEDRKRIFMFKLTNSDMLWE